MALPDEGVSARMRKVFTVAVLISLAFAATGGGWFAFRRLHNDGSFGRQAVMEAGNLQDALTRARAGVRKNQDDPAAHLLLADVALRSLDPVLAQAELDRARAAGADRWTVLIRLGPTLLLEGKPSLVLEHIPGTGPTGEITREFLLARAAALLAIGETDKAETEANAAALASPGSASVSTMLARIALARNDLPAATVRLDEALQRDSQAIDALLMKMRLVLTQGGSTAALPWADRAVAAAPWSNVAFLDRATLRVELGDDAGAQADVAAALRNRPRDPAALLARAVLNIRANRLEDAAAQLQQLAKARVALPRVLFFQAVTATLDNRNESALAFATHSVSLAPNDADGVRLLARLQLRSRLPEQALATLARLTGPNQTDPRTQDLVGIANATLGHLSAAAAAFRTAATEAPNAPDILGRLALAEIGFGSAGVSATLERLNGLAATSPVAGEALVRTALAAGRLDEAAAALERLGAQAGPTEETVLLTGLLQLARQDLAGAELTLVNAVKRFPESVEARLSLAAVLSLLGRPGDAEAALKPALTTDPANPRVLASYTQLLVSRGASEEAIAVLGAAQAANPTAIGFAVMRADIMVRTGHPRQAASMLGAIKPLAQMPPALLTALFQAQDASNEVDGARETLRGMVSASPDDPTVQEMEAGFLLRRGDEEGARTVLRQMLERRPGNLPVMTELVRLAERTGGLDAAVAEAERLRSQPTNMPAAALLRGDLLIRLKRPADAVDAFMIERDKVPPLPLALHLAEAQVRAGQVTQAGDTLRAVAGQPGAADPQVELALARLAIRAGRLVEAQQRLERVVDVLPANGEALNNLAWVYLEQGDSRAGNVARRAYLQAPTPEAADTLGTAFLRAGNTGAALSLLRNAAQVRPDNAIIAKHLTTALDQADRENKAISNAEEMRDKRGSGQSDAAPPR